MANRILGVGVEKSNEMRTTHKMNLYLEFDEPISESDAVYIVDKKLRELLHKDIEVEK